MPRMDNREMRKPLLAWQDDDGSVDILDAEGWHVCRMEDGGDVGWEKAVALVEAFNAAQ